MMTTQTTRGRYLLYSARRAICMRMMTLSKSRILASLKVLPIVLCLMYNISSAQDIPAPVFINEPELSSNSGYLSLNWDYSDSVDIAFVLEVSGDSLFKEARVIYEGPDRATFISGLEDGKYFYRVQAVDGNQSSSWSAMTRVVIEHHSLPFALFLFAVGMTVFAATVGIIVQGNRQIETTNPKHRS